MTAGTVCGVVLAAGSGSRFGAQKQFLELGGRPVVDWSLATARATCDAVVLVVPAGVEALGAVTGGATRSASVRAGLAAVPPGTEIVVIHDSARPLAGPAMWQRVIAAVRAGADAAIPVVAVADTIKRVEGTLVAETLDRSTLVAVQTPQAFRAPMLREAHAQLGEATDDAALVEALGGKVVAVEGDRCNLKLTAPEDLLVAQAFLQRSS